MEITARLENWVRDPIFRIIWGNVYDDSRGRFPDGTLIHTSDIDVKELSNASEGECVDTLNSRYLLGKPLINLRN